MATPIYFQGAGTSTCFQCAGTSGLLRCPHLPPSEEPPPSGRNFDTARAVARVQGQCPGIPTHHGGYSGCRGGADCPVCQGWPMAPEAPSPGDPRVYTATEREALRRHAAAVDLSPMSETLRLLATVDAAEAACLRMKDERDEAQAERGASLRMVVESRTKLAGLLEALPRCGVEGCERHASHMFCVMYEGQAVHYRCRTHHDPDEGDGWGEVEWAAFLPGEGA